MIMINNEQKQLMISALLGDASVSRNKFSFNCMYEEYMKYKSKLSGDLSLGVKEKSNMGYKKGSKIFEFHMSPNDYSKYLRSIPLKEALKEADELTLALWFMDDGSLHKKNYFYNINTHAFSKQEQEDILIPLLNRFNIYPEILKL